VADRNPVFFGEKRKSGKNHSPSPTKRRQSELDRYTLCWRPHEDNKRVNVLENNYCGRTRTQCRLLSQMPSDCIMSVNFTSAQLWVEDTPTPMSGSRKRTVVGVSHFTQEGHNSTNE
jgi:hypothetical protein